MTNEELVGLIQAGECDRLPELWAQVERFVAQQANRRARGTSGAVDFDDLYQAGYLAMVAAADSFDPDKGMAFIGWLALHLKTAFNVASNRLSDRQKRDPIHSAGSLDAPVGAEGDATLGDLQPDPDSLKAFEEAEDRVWRELHDALEKALDTLPEDQADTLRRKFYYEQPLVAIAADTGVSPEMVRQRAAMGLRVLRRPRISRELRQYIEERTPYYVGVGRSVSCTRVVVSRSDWRSCGSGWQAENLIKPQIREGDEPDKT